MKYFDWSEVKNTYLKTERGIGFEDVQAAIEEGRILADIDHPMKLHYPKQKVLIVEFSNYAYVVPYVEDETKTFLKMTRKYLNKRSKP